MKKTMPRSVQPVNLSKYPARSKQEMRLIDKKPYGDRDRDGIPNAMDCKPMNRKKQHFGALLGGLLGVAILANVAGNIINKSGQRIPKGKPAKRTGGSFY